MANTVKKWLGQSETCDICGEGLHRFKYDHWFVDGVERYTRRWALMCADCFKHQGVGIGQGVGQKYSADTMNKLEG